MPMPFYYTSDIYYILILIPIMIFATVAQIKVKTAFSRYSKQASQRGVTGMQAAEEVLRLNGVTGVRIEYVSGNLTDHYDPRTNTIRLSDGVYSSSSIAAVGVAAHEAGHAVQYAKNYAPVRFRTAIIPLTRLGSNLSWPLLVLGLIFDMFSLFVLGIIFFSLCTFFQLVTLPVEFNASHRALESLSKGGILTSDELKGAKKVLTAAALTYIAALAVSLVQLLRYVLIAASRSKRR